MRRIESLRSLTTCATSGEVDQVGKVHTCKNSIKQGTWPRLSKLANFFREVYFPALIGEIGGSTSSPWVSPPENQSTQTKEFIRSSQEAHFEPVKLSKNLEKSPKEFIFCKKLIAMSFLLGRRSNPAGKVRHSPALRSATIHVRRFLSPMAQIVTDQRVE